ncbi:hypothetical protein [Photobacterium carnosum]|uniref:hypothetical protein n=1 Tax=Photobacterium carnosum TaxID=2023717 RepID=UPI001E516F59|nr:hypothetical protein [Photobacterium carnosum]MCD9529471.1 hypothetical protein [Photobacterium carnosum]MCF2153816.1 hypothetical protein [Photobacterium carnosum]MCF2215576.1 hypothetical protein [Photobacterium carnosum]
MSINELDYNIDDAVYRIEKALDLRFEADTTLYISKEDTEKVKLCLANHNFQNITAIATKLGNKVVAKVILKNSWLINFSAVKKSGNKNRLENIFSGLANNFFLSIAEDVITDRVYSTIEFKEFIEGIYYNKVPIKLCQKYYERSTLKLNCRVVCFSRYIQELYIWNNPGAYTVRKIDQVFEQYPDIASSIDGGLLACLTSKMPDQTIVAQWIIEHKINKKTDEIWSSGLLSLGKIGFDESLNYVIDKSDSRNETSKHLIEKICPKFFYKSKRDDIDYLIQSIVNLYKTSHIYRYNLLKMLTPNTFFDKNIANNILDQFELHIESLPSTSKFVSEIRNWTKDERNGYDSIESMRNEFKQNHDLTNIKTLKYLSRQLSKTNIEKIIELYAKSDKEEIKIRLILSYYFATCFFKKSSEELSVIDFTVEYVNDICHYIESERIITIHSKLFLEKYNKIEIITKLFER